MKKLKLPKMRVIRNKDGYPMLMMTEKIAKEFFPTKEDEEREVAMLERAFEHIAEERRTNEEADYRTGSGVVGSDDTSHRTSGERESRTKDTC